MTPFLVAGVGLIATSILACVTFGVAFQVSRVFHLAAGANILFALYLGYFLVEAGISPTLLIPILVVAGASFGAAVERLIYRPLAQLDVPPSRVVIASLGVLVVCQSIIALGFGSELKTAADAASAGVQLTLHAIVIATGVAIAVVVPRWKVHKLFVAVGENPVLASNFGLSSKRVRLVAFAVSGGVAGLLAVVIFFAVGAKPEYGLQYVLLGSVGALVGGSHSVRAWVFGGIALGLIRLLALHTLPHSGYVELITFVLLLMLLLLRSQGYFINSTEGGSRG